MDSPTEVSESDCSNHVLGKGQFRESFGIFCLVLHTKIYSDLPGRIFNSFNYHKADDKIFVCQFSKNVKSKLYCIDNSKTREQNSVDLDEVAHYEPPYQDLCCLQIQLFWSLGKIKSNYPCYPFVFGALSLIKNYRKHGSVPVYVISVNYVVVLIHVQLSITSVFV